MSGIEFMTEALEVSPTSLGAMQRQSRRIDIEDLPIPRDVQVDEFWSPFLAELADHIGAYSALCICQAFAGRDVYIPRTAHQSPFAGIIEPKKVAIISSVYGREKLAIPSGRDVMLRVKRAGIVAAIRAGNLSVSAGAAILRHKRAYLSKIVNETDEGVGVEPTVLPEPRALVALRKAAAIAAEVLASSGTSAELIAETTARILNIWFKPSPQPTGDFNAQSEG